MSLYYAHAEERYTPIQTGGPHGDGERQVDRGECRVHPHDVRQILERAATDRGLSRGPGRRAGCPGGQAQRLCPAAQEGGR